MCYGCWEEAGKPAIINEKTKSAAELARRVYEFNGVGGNLHIVLDDWNLDDEDLQFCSKQIADGGWKPGPQYPWAKDWKPDSADQLATERACCDAFLGLTLDERGSALAIFDRFIDDSGAELAL